MGFNPEDELAGQPDNNSLLDANTTTIYDISDVNSDISNSSTSLDIDEYMNDNQPVTDDPLYSMEDLGLTSQLSAVPSEISDPVEDDVDETLMDLEQYRKHYRKNYNGGGAAKPPRDEKKSNGKKKKAISLILILLFLLIVGGATIYLGKSLKDKISDSSAENTNSQASSVLSTVPEEPDKEEVTGEPNYITGCKEGATEKVREQADKTSPVITELNNGDEVLVVDDKSTNGYLKVTLEDGMSGYIRKSRLVSNPAFVATQKTYYVNVEENEKVALLKKVSAGSDKLGSLTTNQKINLIAKASVKYWYVFSPDLNKYGYIDKDLIKLKKIKTEAQKKKEAEEAEKKKQEEAKKNTLKQEQEKKEEAKKEETKPPVEEPVQTEGTTYYVTGTTYYLALRNGKAFDSSNEIAQLKNGVKVNVIETGDVYWYVYVPSLGINGYVNGDYLTTSKPSGNSNSSSNNNNSSSSKNIYVANVESSYLALRNAKAFDSANEIGKLNNGDKMEVLDSSTGEYWYVYVPSLGLKGYVNSNYIKKQ